MAKGLLIAAFDFSNVAEDEFNDWYDLEHIPERQRVPGFLSLQRWVGAEDARQSVATYDLDSSAVLDSPAYRAIGGENLSPWSKRVHGEMPGCCRASRASRSCPATRARRRRRRAAAGGDDTGAAARDRVQRLVRHRARPGAVARAGSAERPPFPRRRQPHTSRSTI